ncbi:hypothetical protein [Anaerosoma tenue]|mgnify:CR=1 FL=1|uniref:hypothetical protein n=1 Tax=Anaerosoma tenue TaxID=2933588 RepID=UPI002260E5DB|nr:hypothetical protein [Anaerosoma tenue]MCK8114848.1 hypothetical protein [Anaerosoma tenue]
MAMEFVTIETTLARPTEQLARACLEECSFEDRLVGVLMKASGTLPMDLYSLEQVLSFFSYDNSDAVGDEAAVFQDRKLGVSYISPERLSRWVREVVGDAELADGIDAEAAKIEDPNIYPPRMRIMRHLLAARVLQCYEVLGIDPATGEDAAAVSGKEQ